MNTQTQEALKMAIEVMSISMVDTKGVNDDGYWTLNIPYIFASKALQACKDALEQPAQEPVGFTITGKLGDRCSFKSTTIKKGDKVYTHPAPSWQGLDAADWNDFNAVMSHDPQYVARWAEAKLKEKNTCSS